MRAGRFVKQATDYAAFVPAPLPPDPPIRMDDELSQLLSDADRALGRLDGVSSVLPNPELFVTMYVRHEAVLSSQIEGTQSSLDDVLQFEAGVRKPYPQDVSEVLNYVKAMNYGLERLEEFPLSLRLIREIHNILLKGVRGSHRMPGEFRTSQNWIGPEGATLATATFIPPPVPEMTQALYDLERFFHAKLVMPRLIYCGLVHAQFETIHPFLDGNGRMGRLLITFLLCKEAILRRPLLYLSHYLRSHRQEYYDRLDSIRRNGDWEGWMKFFIRGVYEVSKEATETARRILALRELQRIKIGAELGGSTSGLVLLDHLFEQPVISIRQAQKIMECSYATAARLVEQLENMGTLKEITGWQRNRRYRFEPYAQLFWGQRE